VTLVASRPRVELSVIVSTYAWPAALDVVLRALADDTDDRVEVIVAEDASSPATAELVTRRRESLGLALDHVSQPDDGYRRSRILDLAARRARGDLLVFLDGDCIPRRGLVRAIRRAALPGWFLAGKRLHLSRTLSQRVLDGRTAVWRWSALRWLLAAPGEVLHAPRQANSVGLLVPIRDRRRPWRSGSGEFTPPYDAYGCFLVVRRADFERVNGFDARFEGWGHEDVDLAVRLRQAGLRCGWPGPHATLLHLWHPERTQRATANAGLLAETRRSRRIEAVEGMRELAPRPDGP
jgi:glycosyltransferase involved in cell wall biosynthesis